MTAPTIIAPFKPLPWQVKPWRDKSNVLLLEGPSGGGKSRLAAEKIHAFMLKYPGAIGIVGRKDKTAASKSVVPLLRYKVQGSVENWGHYKEGRGVFEYFNGSFLWVVGVVDEKQRQAMRSIGPEGGVDIAWFEEANKLTEEDHNEILVRTRGTITDWTQIVYTTNPDHPDHWIHQRMMLNKEASVYRSTALDNLDNLPPVFLANLDLLTGIQRERLRDGLWKWAEGMVYDNFSTNEWPDGNITDDEPNPDLPIELGVDDGYKDPRAILFFQQRGAEILIFDEMYHTHHLGEVCVKEVIDRCEAWPWEYDEDIDIKDGRRLLPEIAIISHEAVELRVKFRNADIPPRKTTHKIVDGIDVVRTLIQDGQQIRTIKIHRRCKNLIAEITSGYKYPDKGAKRNNENPEDKNNHAVDALRYWCYMRARN